MRGKGQIPLKQNRLLQRLSKLTNILEEVQNKLTAIPRDTL